MVTWFENLPHILQALLATCFTWFVTALGAALVLFFKKIQPSVYFIFVQTSIEHDRAVHLFHSTI